MKRLAILLLAVSLLCGATGAQREPSLQVLVGEFDEDTRSCGISASAIEPIAARTLRDSGIRVVRKSNPYLYIQPAAQPIRISDAMPGCAVYIVVQVRGIHETAKQDLNGFKAKNGAGTVLCQAGAIAIWPMSTIQTHLAAQLERRMKLCLGQLDY